MTAVLIGGGCWLAMYLVGGLIDWNDGHRSGSLWRTLLLWLPAREWDRPEWLLSRRVRRDMWR